MKRRHMARVAQRLISPRSLLKNVAMNRKRKSAASRADFLEGGRAYPPSEDEFSPNSQRFWHRILYLKIIFCREAKKAKPPHRRATPASPGRALTGGALAGSLWRQFAVSPLRLAWPTVLKLSGPMSMQKLRPPLALTRDEITAFLSAEFPQMQIGRIFTIEEVAPMRALLRMHHHPSQLRPGGTVSGPSIFALADVALYVAILGQIGPVKLAVTTNLNINFLSKPAPRDLLGEALLIKLGKRLAVGEVRISSSGDDALVAHATGTYSIPRGESS
jgi:uncharacterized protein (TIGR00369 family)